MRGARGPAVTAFHTPTGLHSTASSPTIRATVPVRSASAAGGQERVRIEDPVGWAYGLVTRALPRGHGLGFPFFVANAPHYIPSGRLQRTVFSLAGPGDWTAG